LIIVRAGNFPACEKLRGRKDPSWWDRLSCGLGVPLARVRADLLAVPAQDVDGRLKPTPSFPALARQKDAVLLVEIACLQLLDGLWGQALGIGLHYGVVRERFTIGSTAPAT
jgi:hypothetical protein